MSEPKTLNDKRCPVCGGALERGEATIPYVLKDDTVVVAMTTPYDVGTSLAGAIIEHPQHGFLLQLRDEHAPSWPLYWSLFGGHLELGESPEVGLWRELAEELQFTPKHALAWELVQRNSRPHGGTQYIYHILTHVTLDTLVLGEGKAMAYVAAADLFDHPLAANGERIFRDHLAGRRDGGAAL